MYRYRAAPRNSFDTVVIISIGQSNIKAKIMTPTTLKNSIFFLCSFVMSAIVQADSDHSHKAGASSHGPIGVMGDHMHKKGEFMFSYRFMRMDMEGNRIGTNRVSPRDIVGTGMAPGQFVVAPTRMPMSMHMLGGMYGVTDNLTLMAMVSYLDNSMDHLVRNGRTFRTESAGVGDTKVSALIRLQGQGRRNMHIGLGVSLPTGSNTERDDTPAMANAVLPYPMQLGSGTFDLLPSFTYYSGAQHLSWGAQVSAIIRTGENDEGYTLGDQISVTSWLAADITANLSVSLRAKFSDRDNIDGANPVLNPRIVQTANTDLQAGNRTDVSLGVNYLFNNGHRLAIEYARPVRQDLDGPQLEIDEVITVGWQKAF